MIYFTKKYYFDERKEMAVCGGVNYNLMPGVYVGLSQLAMLSPDGRCKAWDVSANGYVRSEGYSF